MLNFAIVCLLVSFPLTAHAYIDPGAGSSIIQVAIASIVAGMFGLKVLWQKFLVRTKRK